MRGKSIASSVLILVYASLTYAQNVDVDELNKLRIAQALEQAGEYGKALDFYKQLYQYLPGNFVYFDGLRRTYMDLKMYDDAKALLHGKLKIDSTNIVMVCQLGDVYFKNGQQDSATITWSRALAIEPKNSNAYRIVAQTMADNRLFDNAIEVYRKGEASTIPKAVFSNEIARLYFLDANYGASLHELLKQLQAPQTPYVLSNIESQIAAYSSSKEAVDQFTAEMEKQVLDQPDDKDYRQLLGFLYMETKNYPAAYMTYKWLDDHSGTPGSELFQFAARSYNDEAFDVAAAAFKEVSVLSKDQSVIVQSLVGNAHSLRMLAEKNYSEDDLPCMATDSLDDLNRALTAYEKIIEQYSGTQYFSAAVLNSAELKMNYFHDFTGAEKLLSDYSDRIGPMTDDWTLMRVQLFMKERKFQDAFSTSLGMIQSSSPGVQSMSLPNDPVGSFHDRIEFQAAVALYYLGLYDSAAFYLNRITSNPMSDAANEAIQLLNTITNNRGNPPALRAFASASAMEQSYQIPEASAALEKLLNEYPNAPLADNARFNLAADYCRMGNTAAALKGYSMLAEDSTGVFADRADFRICRIYQETLHQDGKAVAEYENFLTRYPNSIYQNRVRDILRDLLGKNS